ncbi:tetratricopeptide repeat protein [Microbacterium hydrocarbonoxydans]|uniref:tetratricopeptide repeat protein n=1 Tax=Microbacterium hydrocarbonoxydans TaxID=273678 RepID=UPI00203CC99C|nr:tetratricopeptide repeat protein [Microbacterium hydrocarbonoxydans]MCM3780979.1 tetratricopeptide repeat protein [Microbacterium hydrocarbonoxydans]
MKSWDERIDEVWAEASGEEVGDDTIARIDALAAERGSDDARAEFERAGARDSAGRPAEAVALYRRALELGLDEEHRPQCVIQLASSLRNLGRYDEALEVITAEEERSADSPYRDAVATVHALVLASGGKPATGLSVALLALVAHLPRYHRSMTAYAHEIADLDT